MVFCPDAGVGCAVLRHGEVVPDAVAAADMPVAGLCEDVRPET